MEYASYVSLLKAKRGIPYQAKRHTLGVKRRGSWLQTGWTTDERLHRAHT